MLDLTHTFKPKGILSLTLIIASDAEFHAEQDRTCTSSQI